MFHSALICTDFSDGLHRLVDFVPSLAAGGIKKVTFFHSIPVSNDREIPRIDESEVERIREKFAPALQQQSDGIEVAVEIQRGKPVDHIANTVKKHEIDIILLGTASRTLLSEKLFGSTTMELCQRLSTPIMILRPQLISTYTVEELDLRCRHLFRYFLIPYDGSDTSKYLVQQVKRYAEKRPQNSLECCLLYRVVEEVRRRELPKDYQVKPAKEELERVKTDLATLGLQVEAEVVTGNPIAELLTAARDYDISAIATSSGSLGKLFEWSVPSFTGELLRRSWHPVIYFPPAKA
ncbi:universal stress protein [Oculatella sp. LEGE 06141]|uniref:universal stress protein n=1 Tax=Oculatella sp. LEGE 06141 TaxID=1828648 RepID=UPI00187DDF51|nr:universal stress protein [Oculatella sp. LEGE 06141]MBE9179220.1 universal stress protein [Oculatella sp. LEGE 06141]